MCIFSLPVVSVSDTSLFARHGNEGKQFLIYQMRYASKIENAMILPLPTALPVTEDAVRFISLEDYRGLFEDLNSGFPSFMDEQLKSLESKAHPMAFEFNTRWPDRIFFPTVHIHDGQVHDQEDFDHVLYLQHPYFDNVCGRYDHPDAVDKATGLVRSKKHAGSCCKTKLTKGIIDPDLLLHRTSIKGKHENKDIVISMERRKPSMLNSALRHVRNNWLAVPGLVVATGLAWVFHRRSKLKNLRNESNSDQHA